MPVPFDDVRRHFERGVVILSFDVEQIWGYLDLLDEAQFRQQHPNAVASHTRMLECLAAANIRATWFVVGALGLRGSEGDRDQRMSGLPYSWTARIPAGNELTAPLWYCRSFLKRLRNLQPQQEIGLHGGLTHFIWTDPLATREVLEWELAEGVRALEDAGVTPVSFSFGREQEACHSLLPAHGIICYRGRTVAPSFRLGPNICGKAARLFDEMRRATPHLVWPIETLPGLWNIPSSLFLYSIHASRIRFTGIQSRVDRFSRGMQAAARYRGIFHFCLHPENLTQSPQGFAMFEQLVERLDASRRRGDIEILTMRDVVVRMECANAREFGPHMPACNHIHETVHTPNRSATFNSTVKWRPPFTRGNR